MRTAKIALLSSLCLIGVPYLAHGQDQVLAVVNGKPVDANLVDAYLQQRLRQALPADRAQLRQQILPEVINYELVVQDALAQGLDKRPEVAIQIELQRRNLLANAAFGNYVAAHPISDADLKREYESQRAAMQQTDYRLRHVLVNTEEEAKSVIAALDRGENFTTLAKRKSSGPSATDGGDLGWMSPGQMEPAFLDAVAVLTPGMYTKTPVHTRFGWHIILLEGRRDTPPPTFEQVKPQLHQSLQQRLIEQYVTSLRTKAKIESK